MAQSSDDAGSKLVYDNVMAHLETQRKAAGRWETFTGLLILAALPWIISAGASYFMLAWRTIP